jgi:hypothetical protein
LAEPVTPAERQRSARTPAALTAVNLPLAAVELPAAPRRLDELRVLISSGHEMNPLRETAADVLERFNQFLMFDRGSRFVLTQWDYRRDSSRDEDVGDLARKSLEAVEESDGVVAIVGASVPETTRLEIRHVYELRQRGQERELWFFVYRKQRAITGPDRISLRAFLDGIEGDFHKTRIFHEVASRLDFQASLMIELLPFLVARTGLAIGPIQRTSDELA